MWRFWHVIGPVARSGEQRIPCDEDKEEFVECVGQLCRWHSACRIVYLQLIGVIRFAETVLLTCVSLDSLRAT